MRRGGRQFLYSSLMVAAVGLLAMAGCSSFDRQWKQAPTMAQAGDSLAGRWQGQWISGSTGQSGPARGVIVARPGGGYQVTIEAERWGMLTRQTSWTMAPDQHNRVYHFRSQNGDYRYEGQVVGSRLEAYYFRTAEDHGRLELSRLD